MSRNFLNSLIWLRAGAALVLGMWCAVCAAAAQSAVVVAGANPADAPTASQEAAVDVLQLLDGSLLHGRLQNADATTGLQWAHSDARQPLKFRPENLESIRFDAARAVSSAVNADCRFRFRNGDDLFGSLKSLDADSAILETWFGKNMTVPRASLESVAFLSKSFKLLYEGPGSGDGWHFGRGSRAWEYRDGALVGRGVGTVGRDLKLPGSMSLEFDVSWTGPFGLIIQTSTEHVDRIDYSSSSYMFHMNQISMGLQRVHSDMGVMNLGRPAPIPNPNKKSNYHVEIRANKEEATLAVLVDGVLLQKWKDEAGFNARGSSVVFFTQHEGPTIKITNIKVSEWDGKFEDERPAESGTTDDILRLANRDRVAGKVGALRDGKLTVKAAETELEIPMQRVTQIFFAQNITEKTEQHPWEARAHFASGEKLSFQMDKWTAEAVTGRSAVLGEVSFSPHSVRLLQFNLGKQTAVASAEQEDWENENASAATLSSSVTQDALVLRNGDVFFGRLSRLLQTNTLSWQRDDLIEPVDFLPSSVSEIRLREPEKSASMRGNVRVHLLNDDQLEGQIASINADTVLLETWYAGRLSIPRNRVVMIVPQAPSNTLVFEGPDSPEGWTMGKVTAVQDAGEWQFKNNAFYATRAASIARDMKLPDVARIEFDLAWKGTLQAAVALYTAHLQPINLANKDTEPDFGGFYSLQINTVSAGLMIVKKDSPLKYLFQLNVPAFSQKNSVHVDIRVDKPRRTLTLMVDGTVVRQIVDPEDFAGTGTAMRFVHQGFGSLRLSNLRISEWDGQFEEKPENSRGENDLVKLRNRDRVNGYIERFRDGKFVVSTDSTTLDIPLERIKQLELAGKKLERTRPDPAEAVAYFRSGASVNFRIERWDENGIQAFSPYLGAMRLNPAAFARIEFKARDESAPKQ